MIVKTTQPEFRFKLRLPKYIHASTQNILLSENLAVGELFIGKPPVDERRSNNDSPPPPLPLLIGPCQQGVLSWRGK